MIILPAIDLVEKKAVRLYKGDFTKMTVYNDDPVEQARIFEKSGASYIHMVDLDGARTGKISNNSSVIAAVKKETSLFVEIGGGIRDDRSVSFYIDEVGVDRVILGTKALTDRAFLGKQIERYGDHIAVGIDIRDGKVSINGWKEDSDVDIIDFLADLNEIGVRTVIVTDISRDGTLQGANKDLYKNIKSRFDMDLVASGGVSDADDIKRLKEAGLYGAIVGKAYYEGNVTIEEALEAAK